MHIYSIPLSSPDFYLYPFTSNRWIPMDLLSSGREHLFILQVAACRNVSKLWIYLLGHQFMGNIRGTQPPPLRESSQDLDKWFGSPLFICHEWSFGKNPRLPLLRGVTITLVINHLLIGMILHVVPRFLQYTRDYQWIKGTWVVNKSLRHWGEGPLDCHHRS